LAAGIKPAIFLLAFRLARRRAESLNKPRIPLSLAAPQNATATPIAKTDELRRCVRDSYGVRNIGTKLKRIRDSENAGGASAARDGEEKRQAVSVCPRSC